MAQCKKDTEALIKSMPPILAGTSSFQPTKLMQRAVWLYVMQDEPEVRKILDENGVEGKGSENLLSITQILVTLGHSRTNYYLWTRMPGFFDWLNTTVTSLLEKESLQKVHLNLMRRAQTTHDAALLKLALQRFDPKFVPKAATTARHEVFAGYEPCSKEEQERAIENSRQRQREAMAKREYREVVPSEGPIPGTTADESKGSEAET